MRLQGLLMSIANAESDDELKENMRIYKMLPDDFKGAIGYLRCLVESGSYGPYSAYGRFRENEWLKRFKGVPLMRLPLAFIGWGGKTGNVGPAYEIDGTCHIGRDSRIFYTDDDIQEDADAARQLADGIRQESSGVADVRTERLGPLRTSGDDIGTSHWCVTFRLDDGARKEVFVDGTEVGPGEGTAVLIVPKRWEFDCMLGEVVKGNPENAFVLASHSYFRN